MGDIFNEPTAWKEEHRIVSVLQVRPFVLAKNRGFALCLIVKLTLFTIPVTGTIDHLSRNSIVLTSSLMESS
jgi:hypothetical protein